MKKILCCAGLGIICWGCNPGTNTMEESAKRIHEKVLTVDSHTDTPWALLEGGFDLNDRHDFT